MIDPHYNYFVDVGFWFVLGCTMALAVVLMVVQFATITVNLVLSLVDRFNTLRKSVFKVLPEDVIAIELSYSRKAKILTATGCYKLNGSEDKHYMTRHVQVESPGLLRVMAENVQLQLLTDIRKEINK